ncbi:MAG: tetratricopeptide repeat protein [Candidatus Competibacter sp.]
MRTDHKDMLSVLGHFFLEHGQTDKALVLLDALQALFPEDPDIAKSLSYACLQAGRYQEALDAANRGIAERDAAFIHLLRSKALWGLGRADEARACLARYLALRSSG